jgi:uncharacterized OB-fold protein
MPILPSSGAPLPDEWTLPRLNAVNRLWFESGALLVQTCAACAVRQHPPEEICHRCGSMEFTSTELSSGGVIHSFTVVHYAVNGALADSVPYAVILVALDDDPEIRIVGNLLDSPPEAVHIGMRVRASWQERTDGDGTVQLLQWEPHDRMAT